MLFALVSAVALLAPARASAHVGHVIQRAERYLKLDVDGPAARVVVSLTLGPDEGRRVLAAADEDGDGEVDERERDAYLAQWGDGLRDEVPIAVDGEPVEIAWGDGFLDPIGRVRATPVTVEMVARLTLEGEQTVRFEDRMVRREVYERTDVAFRARGDAELIATGLEEEPTDVTRDLSYDGGYRPGEPIAIVARLRTPEKERSAWLLPAIALGGAALLGVVAWARRRRPGPP